MSTNSSAAGQVKHAVPRTEIERQRLVRRGIVLGYLTIAYNSLEAVVSLIAGVVAGSVALVGFGLDSVIEVTASLAAQVRLRAEFDHERRVRLERTTHRVVGWCFIALAVYVALDASAALLQRESPTRTVSGVVILGLSIVVMPLLARAKRRVARAIGSAALESEATQTSLCAYLSAIALGGVALNLALGWWWADPAAALVMTPLIAREGLSAIRGQECAC